MLALWSAFPQALPPAESAPTVSTPAARAPTDRPRILVLDLEQGDVDPKRAKTINALLISIVAREAPAYDVVSSTDLRRMMDLEADRQAMQCDADAQNCAAELADALGAEQVLFGTLGRLGRTTIITIDLLDGESGQAIGRESVEISDVDDVPRALRGALARLFQGRRRAQGSARALGPTGASAVMWTTIASASLATAAFAGAGWANHMLSQHDKGVQRLAVDAYGTTKTVGLGALIAGGVGTIAAAGAGFVWWQSTAGVAE